MPVTIICSLIAVLIEFMCLLLVFHCWQGRARPALHTWLLLAAWSGLALCFLPWKRAFGAETAAVLTVSMPAFFAWIFVAGNRQDKGRKTGKAVTTEPRDPSFRLIRHQGVLKWLVHCSRFLQISILSLMAALSVGTAITVALGLEMQNAMATTVLLLPLLWGVAAWWAAADDTHWRSALGLTGLTLICTAGILLVEAA